MTDIPHPIDVLVGANLRRIRKSKGFIQKDLGDLLGITYVSIQKYETATNRVSASTLWEFAQFLDTPVEEFFHD